MEDNGAPYLGNGVGAGQHGNATGGFWGSAQADAFALGGYVPATVYKARQRWFPWQQRR
jgi:hypothetical protein